MHLGRKYKKKKRKETVDAVQARTRTPNMFAGMETQWGLTVIVIQPCSPSERLRCEQEDRDPELGGRGGGGGGAVRLQSRRWGSGGIKTCSLDGGPTNTAHRSAEGVLKLSPVDYTRASPLANHNQGGNVGERKEKKKEKKKNDSPGDSYWNTFHNGQCYSLLI